MNSDISVMQVIKEAIHELEKKDEVLKAQLEAINEQRIDILDNLIVLGDIKRMLEKERETAIEINRGTGKSYYPVGYYKAPMSGPTPWEEGDGERYDFSSSGYRKLKTDYLNGKSGGAKDE